MLAALAGRPTLAVDPTTPGQVTTPPISLPASLAASKIEPKGKVSVTITPVASSCAVVSLITRNRKIPASAGVSFPIVTYCSPET